MATNFVTKFAKWLIPPSFGMLAFQNELQDHNFRRLNGNDFSTLYKNLVRFGPVIPEFTNYEGRNVQPVWIVTGVSLTTFAKGLCC